MGKLLLVVLVLLAGAAGFGWFTWSRAVAAEQAAYDASAKPENAKAYVAWAEQLKTANALHFQLLEQAGPLQAHLTERTRMSEAYERERAAAAAAAEAAAKAEAARTALTPEQRRARWVQEYAVSAAGIDPGVRDVTTALLTRAAAEGRGLTYKIEVTNAVSEKALKAALEGFDVAVTCKLEQRKTPAVVDLVTGDVAAEGVKVRVSWLDGKETVDAHVTEKGKQKKVKIKLGATRVAIDLRAPNAQPIHKEQDVAIDSADFEKRVSKTGSLADAYATEASTLSSAACLQAATMLGLRDP